MVDFSIKWPRILDVEQTILNDWTIIWTKWAEDNKRRITFWKEQDAKILIDWLDDVFDSFDDWLKTVKEKKKLISNI